MSNNWYRFGPSPFSGPPLPIDTIYYLAYRDAFGLEEVTHTYDKVTKQFSIINATHQQVTNSAAAYSASTGALSVYGWPLGLSVAVSEALTTFSIDGQAVLVLDDGVLKAKQFSEFPAPEGRPQMIFYSRSGIRPTPLAVVTVDGDFCCPRITESDDFPDGIEAFRFESSGVIKAAISISGLTASDVFELEDVMITESPDLFEFDGGDLWAL